MSNQDNQESVVRVQKSIVDVSSDLIEDLFTKYYEEKIALFAGIDTYDISCSKDSDNKAIVNVQIYGNAGAPTVDDFKNDQVKFQGIKNIVIERSDIGSFEFELKRDKTVLINSNDYLIVYESK